MPCIFLFAYPHAPSYDGPEFLVTRSKMANIRFGSMKIFVACIFFLFASSFAYPSAHAYDGPEFLVTRSKMANIRVGPGKNYDVRWIYTKRSTPLKVLARVDRWVKVQDCEGGVGWMMAHLLYKRNYVMTKSDGTVFFRSMHKNCAVSFTADACVIMKLEQCKGEMCKVSVQKLSGWTDKANLWGVND